MPNIKSAKKRVLVTEVKRAKNQAAKSELKTAIKKVDVAVTEGDVQLAGNELVRASKKIDRAVAKGLLHKNTAARRKSSLARKVNGLSAQ